MFRSLKEKLKMFRKKASEELQDKATSSSSDIPTGAAGAERDIQPKKPLGTVVKKKLASKPESKTSKELTKGQPEKIIEPEKQAVTPILRKRSRLSKQPVSLKRQIEVQTSEDTPWKMIESKPIAGEVEGGWFAKTMSESKLDSILWDLEMALLESDVALPVVEEIKNYLKDQLLTRKYKQGTNFEDIIEDSLKNAVIKVLQSEIIHFDNFITTHDKPVKLMFVGVNGTGKTSAIAKLVFRLKKQKHSCVIAASDTFRAGAIEQLEKHANKLGVKLIKDKAGSDPAAIAFDTIEHAKARHKDVVLIDTAGRMQTNQNLMAEMRKIKRIANPDMIIFVGDALAGNDVVEQAKQFDEVVGIDAAILTKVDADAKGGAALSIAHAIGKPILFISVGQRYGDLLPFNPKWLVERIFE